MTDTGSVGDKHCSLMPRDENVEIDRDVAVGNDPCPFIFKDTDYVYDSWITDNGRRIGDVQSSPITCHY